MNIDESLTQFVEDTRINRSENTARAYYNGMEQFRFFLTDIQKITLDSPLEALTLRQFRSFPGWLVRRAYVNKTVGVYLSAMRRYIAFLNRNDLFSLTWSESAKLDEDIKYVLPNQEPSLKRFPKEGEAESIIKAAEVTPEPSPRGERDFAIILCLYSSGCRNDELVKLKIEDFDFVERSAIVRGKRSKDRVAHFSPEACDALKHYWAVRKSKSVKEPAFIRHDKGAGKKIKMISTTTVRNVVSHYAGLAGIEPKKFSPHYFRHNFAIATLRQTHDLALVQDLLGHKGPEATRIYAKIYPDELKEQYRKIWG